MRGGGWEGEEWSGAGRGGERGRGGGVARVGARPRRVAGEGGGGVRRVAAAGPAPSCSAGLRRGAPLSLPLSSSSPSLPPSPPQGASR